MGSNSEIPTRESNIDDSRSRMEDVALTAIGYITDGETVHYIRPDGIRAVGFVYYFPEASGSFFMGVLDGYDVKSYLTGMIKQPVDKGSEPKAMLSKNNSSLSDDEITGLERVFMSRELDSVG
jgi:hypothetical protein